MMSKYYRVLERVHIIMPYNAQNLTFSYLAKNTKIKLYNTLHKDRIVEYTHYNGI